MVSSLYAKRGGKSGTSDRFSLHGPKIFIDGDCSHEIKSVCSLNENYENSIQCIKKLRHHFVNKDPYSQTMGFLVVIYGCESIRLSDK